MKKLFGAILILGGVVFGAYVGIWIFLIGGVVDVVDGAKATPTNGGLIVWGLVQVLCLAGGVGGAAFWVLALPGFSLLFPKKRRSRRTSMFRGL